MSRTDKDVPYRIKRYRGGQIKHNHLTGECREESRDHALKEGRFITGRNHWRKCKKRERVETVCPGRYECYHARRLYTNLIELHTPYAIAHEYDRRLLARARNTRPENFLCREVHYTTIVHDEIACSFCDIPREDPTCEYEFQHNFWWSWYNQAAPREYRNQMQRDNRRKVKAATDDARRDYNENGDTDVDPRDKYAPRSASWYYW